MKGVKEKVRSSEWFPHFAPCIVEIYLFYPLSDSWEKALLLLCPLIREPRFSIFSLINIGMYTSSEQYHSVKSMVVYEEWVRVLKII